MAKLDHQNSPMTSLKRKNKQKAILAEIEELNIEEDKSRGKLGSNHERSGSGVRVVFDDNPASMFDTTGENTKKVDFKKSKD